MGARSFFMPYQGFKTSILGATNFQIYWPLELDVATFGMSRYLRPVTKVARSQLAIPRTCLLATGCVLIIDAPKIQRHLYTLQTGDAPLALQSPATADIPLGYAPSAWLGGAPIHTQFGRT